ncbi:hypothetical protein [Arundinibacter roseus]|uniref:Uncharacterized protein n=1 Tax=Arundinibacter roseus TaxID=2070510 RepID=A0A4R4KIM5_9BACT|nr:hypothetical protein [Arundinibacter roseus]TDB68064.1 hypothetical protein EZE20_03850 [Arundinibacter roseus]
MSHELQPLLRYLELLSVKVAKLEAEQIVARNMIGKLTATLHQAELTDIEALQRRLEYTTKLALLPSIMEGMAVLSEAEVRRYLGVEDV